MTNDKKIAYLSYLRDMGDSSIAIPLELRKVEQQVQPVLEHSKMEGEPVTKRIVHTISEEELLAKQTALEEIATEIARCQNCPLHETRNKTVPGAGSPNADIIFIGEAPGGQEDKYGIPFVGRAGKLLDKIFAAAGLTRDDVFIANILKCRPPGNRDPLPAEELECMPYLLKQIEIIQPSVICCLGRVSSQKLLQTTTAMGKLRQQKHFFRGIPLIVTYHPAALLRNPAYKRPTWEDIKFLMRIVEERKAQG